MPRRTATAPRTEAAEVEGILPPNQVPAEERDTYWNGLLEDISLMRAAIGTTEFFPLLREIPKALWEKRLIVYLYRTHPKIKNATGEKAYIEKLAHPFDEDYVRENHGGGGYTAYLNLDSKDQLKQTSFMVDGPPKYLPGQTMDSQGNALPQPTPSGQPPAKSEVAQILEATAASNATAIRGAEQVMEIGGELLKKQLGLTPPAENKLQDQLMQALITRMLAPQPDAMATALTLLEKMESINAKRNPAPADEHAHQETPLSETLDAIKELTGGVSLPELMKPVAKAAAVDATPAWVPAALSLADRFLASLPQLLAQAAANRAAEFERQLYVRNLQTNGQPQQEVIPPRRQPGAPPPAPTPIRTTTRLPGFGTPQPPPAASAPPPTNPTTPPDQVDPAVALNAMIQMICTAFDKDPRSGFEVAAAIAHHFSDVIESQGFDRTIANPEEITKFVAGVPVLAQRSQDARWKMFQNDFLAYTTDRWGDEEDEPNAGGEDSDRPPAA